MPGQHRIRADRFPQLGHHAVCEAEGVLRRIVRDSGLGLDKALVAAEGAVDAGEERQRRVDRGGGMAKRWFSANEANS